MPAMAKPPANAITLPLDPSRFDGMQITDERYKANGRGFVPSTGAGAAPAAPVGAAAVALVRTRVRLTPTQI
jgi:hypothetical protein